MYIKVINVIFCHLGEKEHSKVKGALDSHECFFLHQYFSFTWDCLAFDFLFFLMQVWNSGNPTTWATQNGTYVKIAKGHKTQPASSIHMASSAL